MVKTIAAMLTILKNAVQLQYYFNLNHSNHCKTIAKVSLQWCNTPPLPTSTPSHTSSNPTPFEKEKKYIKQCYPISVSQNVMMN